MNPMEMLLDAVEWVEVPRDASENNCGLPWVTHAGVLMIGDIALKVSRLSNGERVIDQDDFLRFFGFDDAGVIE